MKKVMILIITALALVGIVYCQIQAGTAEEAGQLGDVMGHMARAAVLFILPGFLVYKIAATIRARLA